MKVTAKLRVSKKETDLNPNNIQALIYSDSVVRDEILTALEQGAPLLPEKYESGVAWVALLDAVDEWCEQHQDFSVTKPTLVEWEISYSIEDKEETWD